MCTAFFSQDYDNSKMPQIVFLQPVVFELQTKMFRDSLWEKLRFCKKISRNYNELSLVMKVSKQKALRHSLANFYAENHGKGKKFTFERFKDLGLSKIRK